MPDLAQEALDAAEIVAADRTGSTAFLLHQYHYGQSDPGDDNSRSHLVRALYTSLVEGSIQRAKHDQDATLEVLILVTPTAETDEARLLDPRKAELLLAVAGQIDNAQFAERTWARFTPKTLAYRMLHSVPNITSAGNSMWDEAIGPFFDTTGLRLWKGVTRQRLDALRKSNRLIALTSADNKLLYPEFQFGPAGELLPHLDEVLPALRRSYNDWDAALWLNTPSDDWDGKTAAQVLREGDQEAWRRILAEARADAASLAS